MTDLADAPSPPPSPQSSARRDDWLWAGLLVILTLIVYQPAIRGEFLWDDDRYVMMGMNAPLRSAGGLAKIWFHPSTTRHATSPEFTTVQYYPLTFTAFWLQYRLWGLNTVGYHVVNVLLHAGAALMLWRLLKLLHIPGAWVAAAIFAVHPIEVESVAWITELKNVLSGLLFLASIYAYLRFAAFTSSPDTPADPALHPSSFILHPFFWYAISFLLFTGAVFAKSVTSVMPAVTALLLFWRFRHALNLRTLAGLVPFLVLGALLGRQTAWMEQHIVGAMGPDWDLNFTQRLLVAGHAFWFYLDKLLWPANLAFTYPRWDPSDASQWLHVAGAGAVILAGAAMLLTQRLGGIGVAILAYTLMLFPAMGFFNVYPMRYSFVADHFQYLPGIAFIVLIVGSVTSRIWRGQRDPRSQPAQILAGIVILLLAILTWRQSSIYASPIALWTDTVAKNPAAWMAHYNLGTELVLKGLRERAAGDPDAAAADSFNDAAAAFENCIAHRPSHANAYANWGVALMEAGQFPQAVEKLHKSIELNPNNDQPHVTLGLIHLRTGKPAEARAAFETAISVDPESWRAHLNLGHLAAAGNNLPAAEASFRQAAQLRPSDPDARYALAVILDRQGKYADALPHAIRAAELQPDNAEVLATLGFIWGSNGRPREAYDAFRRALEHDPQHPRAIKGAEALIGAVGEMQRAATRPATTRATTEPLPATAPTP